MKKSGMSALGSPPRSATGVYVDEMAFRYTSRDNEFTFRDVILRIIDAETLRYRELVA